MIYHSLKTIIPATILALQLSPALSAENLVFHGQVATYTCEVSVNGEDSPEVLLRTLTPEQASQINDPTYLIPFTISLDNCPTSESTRVFQVAFLGHNIRALNLGNIIEGEPNAAEGYVVALANDPDTRDWIRLNPGQVTTTPGLTLQPGQTSTSREYGARIISVLGATTKPGRVVAVTSYAIRYD